MFNFVNLMVNTAGLYNSTKFLDTIKNSVGVEEVNHTVGMLISKGRSGQTIVIDGVTYLISDYQLPANTSLECLVNMGYLIMSSEYEADVVIDDSKFILSKGRQYEFDESKVLTPEQLNAFWLRLASWQKMSFNLVNVSKRPVTLSEVYGLTIPNKEKVKTDDFDSQVTVLDRDAKFDQNAMYFKGYVVDKLTQYLRAEEYQSGNANLWLIKGLVNTI